MIRQWWQIRAVTGLLIVLLAVVFQAVSVGVETYLRAHGVVDLRVFQLRLSYNTGVAFSFGASWPPVVLIAVTVAVIAMLLGYLLLRSPHLTRAVRIAGVAIAGGAVSNLADRIFRGAVTDYFHTGWFATFNLADTGITLGAATLVAAAVFQGPGRPAMQRKDFVDDSADHR